MISEIASVKYGSSCSCDMSPSGYIIVWSVHLMDREMHGFMVEITGEATAQDTFDPVSTML